MGVELVSSKVNAPAASEGLRGRTQEVSPVSSRNPIEAQVRSVLDAATRDGWTPDPTEVAMALIDQDVAEGLYEGCSPEMELAYGEYVAAAQRVLGDEKNDA
jgi:hypothetical protein